jgi:tRNA pseudouridine13 synthase
MPALPDYAIPDWRRAADCQRIKGNIRQTASDFLVTEILGFAPSGDGEHDFLWIEKTGVNTNWLAQQLARHAGVPERDVGYAGLKDRNAVTRQWFSVRRPRGTGTDWQAFARPGVDVLQMSRHDRKLRRGVHAGNFFRLAVRDVNVDADDIGGLVTRIVTRGVPNYFGDQRFGRHGENMRLALALFCGRRMRRNKRSIAISAARSYIFNHILQERVVRDCWDRALVGEAFNLSGSNSIFVADELTDEFDKRLLENDIHPTAALWGAGRPQCTGEALALECAIAAPFDALCGGLERIGARQARRPTRLIVQDLVWEIGSATLWLEFSLPSGGYATTVLRELLELPVPAANA